MIIAEHKVIFIHIPKNAGTSIKSYFGYDLTSKEKFKHSTIYEIKKEYPDLYKSYKKFAIVRNPYDRMISWYAYLSGFRWNNDAAWQLMSDDFKNSYFNDFKNFIKHPNSDNWIDTRKKLLIDAKWGEKWRLNLLKPQVYWIDKTVTILKYENLKEELNNLFKKEIDLPIENKTICEHYLKYYDTESLNMVYDKYKEDFEKFNYKKL
tara:strand:+ start:169 stop:789 length:621 start_codon:yes stop_codon:yes gene_type:complete